MLEQIMMLKNASVADLQNKHLELFDDKKAPSNNKVYLWRKIAYRMQEIEYGGGPAETLILHQLNLQVFTKRIGGFL